MVRGDRVTMRRIERDSGALKRPLPARRRPALAPASERPELALAYSNGYVTVEISHDALDAYIELTGNVPLPVEVDVETGDRRTYDARHGVRVVYDRDVRIREVATRSPEGLIVRLNFAGGD